MSTKKGAKTMPEVAERPDTVKFMKLLTPEDVMEILGITSRSTLGKYLRRKKDPLPSLKIGRLRRFQSDKVMHWFEDQYE
jgi:hypothetical protein